MQFSSCALAVFLAGISASNLIVQTEAFSPAPTFSRACKSVQRQVQHRSGCSCPSCTGVGSAINIRGKNCNCAACKGGSRKIGCNCPACTGLGFSTRLFADATAEDAEPAVEEEEEVPAAVEAMDGVESEEEAHNSDRPARKELKKKRPSSRGTPLSEFEVNSTVSATVKSVTNYGAFCDFGATTDGLVHISRMSTTYVNDVSELIKEGDTVDVRIVEIDADKNQVALSLLTVEEEAAAKSEGQQRGGGGRERGGGGGRRDDSALLSAIEDKGWDSEAFVAGKVVSTVTFGAFVKVDAKQLNSELEGEFDGLVHISSLIAGRASSVTDHVNVGDSVQVRVKAVGGGKVSLSMVSAEDEAANADRRSFDSDPGPQGAKDWKEQLEKLQASSMGEYTNTPLITDLR